MVSCKQIFLHDHFARLDVWWGIVETTPGKYNFDAYQQIVGLAKNAGLKMQVVCCLLRVW